MRQSPSAMNSDSCRPIFSWSVITRSAVFAKFSRARSISSAVGGLSRNPSTWRISSACTGSTGSPFFTKATTIRSEPSTPFNLNEADLRRLAGFDKSLVQAAGGSVPQGEAGKAQRLRVLMQRRWHLVAQCHDLQVAHAAHDEAALAILGGLDGPEFRQRAARVCGITPKYLLTSCRVFSTSNFPATSSTALSGW